MPVGWSQILRAHLRMRRNHGGSIEEAFRGGSIRRQPRNLRHGQRGRRMRPWLPQHSLRCLRRRWLGHRRARMERMPCRSPGSSPVWTWLCLATSLQSLFPELRGLAHNPEKWVPVFPRDKCEAFARRSCSRKRIEREDFSKKSHHARSWRVLLGAAKKLPARALVFRQSKSAPAP